MTASALYLCPECGSPIIDSTGILSDSIATCRACGWSGSSSRLAAMPFNHQLGMDGDLMHTMVMDLRSVIAKELGVPLVKYLAKWGFLSEDRQVAGKQVGRYMAVLARVLLTSVLEEREKMENERVAGS